MTQPTWDQMLTPPKNGLIVLRKRIADLEVHRRQLRLTLLTIVFVLAWFYPPEFTLKNWFSDQPQSKSDFEFQFSIQPKHVLKPLLETKTMVLYQAEPPPSAKD